MRETTPKTQNKQTCPFVLVLSLNL